jgi:hypothetical protein
MKLVTLLSISAVIYVVAGLLLLFGIAKVPDGVGFSAERATNIEAQILGAALIGLGCVNWVLLPSGDLGARKAIAIGNFIFHSIATLAVLRLLLLGMLTHIGIGIFGTHILLMVAYGYIIFVSRNYCEVRFD